MIGPEKLWKYLKKVSKNILLMPQAPAPSALILREFLFHFEQRIASLRLAEKWDNVGFLVESPKAATYSSLRLLTCIDLTNDVVSEAVSKNCNVIFSYHPVMFRPIQSLSVQAQLPILRCLDSGISVFVPHTALDSSEGGMNDFLADKFLEHQLSRGAVSIDPGTGAQVGRIVRFTRALTLNEVVDVLKKSLRRGNIRVATNWELSEPRISSVAVCVGSGYSVLKDAHADVCLTGEMTHHDILACKAGDMSAILLDHSSSERPFLPDLVKRLSLIECVSSCIQSEADIEPIITV
jgi:dinuclear metal center YbgI/SA1388 family protein